MRKKRRRVNKDKTEEQIEEQRQGQKVDIYGRKIRGVNEDNKTEEQREEQKKRTKGRTITKKKASE